MLARRPLLGWLPSLFLLLFLSAASTAVADSVLVVPFENTARVADLDWVGESFAEALTEHLAGAGHAAIARDERLAGLQRLGLPATAPLSRATLLRLGEEVGADWVVLGQFAVDEDQIHAQARLLDLRKPSLSLPAEDQDSFAHLLDLQGQLAWRILRRLDPAFSLNWAAFRQRVPALQVSAFESYVRGLLAMNREQQKRYFLQAARIQPDYSAPAFRLAQLYFEDEDYATAAEWFNKIPRGGSWAPEARFYLSLCHFRSKKFDQAAQTLAPLASRFPGHPLWNNLGVFSSRQGESDAAVAYFTRALEDDPGDADIYFNLGVHYLRQAQWEPAARALRQCVQWNAGDNQAHLLYAYALARLGRTEEAERHRQQAGSENVDLEWDMKRETLDLDRVHQHFSPFLPNNGVWEASSARLGHVAVHIERGEDFLARGALEEAQKEFTEAVLLDPASYSAHFLLAHTYRRQGRLDEAMAELKAALWSKETVEARLLLAEIYLARSQLDEARQQVQAALALDPGNAAARALDARLPVQRAVTPAEESSPE